MFKVVTERRRRRVWTPRTVAASVGAHLLLLGVFVTVAESTPAPPREREIPIDLFPNTPAKQPTPPKTPEPPRSPNLPPPVKGTVVAPQPPVSVPNVIPPPDPNATPIHDAQMDHAGDVLGTPDPGHPATTGDATPTRGWGDDTPVDAGDVSVLPQLSNEREARRMLERVYPPALRDAGVTGQTIVTLIIDKQGNVEPGSARVMESSHPGFDQAALRAVEKFHFTPAQLNGHAVSVVIALPIDWQLEQH